MSEPVAPLGSVDYALATPPDRYACGICNARGVKLWREYQTFLNHQTLACAKCACADQSKDGKSYSIEQDESGRVNVMRTFDAKIEPRLHKIYGGRDTSGGDQIGWRIPAVPTDDGETYWGYSSVPDAAVAWWNRLPLESKP